MSKLEKLKDVFPSLSIEWRVQKSGISRGMAWAMVLAYVTNRAIMDRLDEVCGMSNWSNQFLAGPDGGVVCGISINVGCVDGLENEWVTKWDGAENTKVEEIKGGLSSAMKRAAVQWGIGRYLYDLDTTFLELSETKTNNPIEKMCFIEDKDGVKKKFFWLPPTLPDWARPKNELVTNVKEASLFA